MSLTSVKIHNQIVNNKQRSKLSIIDTFIVLFNIASARGNYLLFGLLGLTESRWVEFTIICVDILYCILRFRKRDTFKNINRYYAPIFFGFAIILYNSLNVAIINGRFNFIIVEYLIVDILFFYILLNLFNEIRHISPSKENTVKELSKGYVWISMFSFIGVILSFSLLLMEINLETPIYADYMASNSEISHAEYYRSFLSVKMESYDLRVPFFQEFGYLCGLFHEPHIFAYNVFPCLLLMFAFTQKQIENILISISLILVVLFTGSATNILTALGCLLVYVILRSRRNFWGVSLSLLLLAGGVYVYYSVDTTLFEFVIDRLDSDNMSQQHSKSLLEFAFSVKTFWGTDSFSTSVVDGSSKEDVGLIVFILLISFLITYFRNVLMLLFKKERLSFAIGLASFYFIIHSAKAGLPMFTSPLFLVMVFLQAITLTSKPSF